MADQQTSISVEAHYIKSNYFRVIHVDGVYGGINGYGLLNCSFYSERGALPRKTLVSGTLGSPLQETVLETKAGIVREIESEIVMSLTAAIGFHHWLGRQIEDARTAMNISDENTLLLLTTVNAFVSFAWILSNHELTA